MKLETYVRRHYASVAEAARDFGISRQYLYEIFHKRTTPRPSTAKRIEKCTKGTITAASILGV